MRRFKLSKGGVVIPYEHDEQAALVTWADAASHAEPDLGLLFAIPNGGHRHPKVAQKMKAEGQKPGVADLLLPTSRPRPGEQLCPYCAGRPGPYHGLFLEMKAQDGRLSPPQSRFRDLVVAQGYAYGTGYGLDGGMDIIKRYLKGEYDFQDGSPHNPTPPPTRRG